MLLRRLRDNGAKVFLLTNSDYNYTNHIMKYLLETVQKLSQHTRNDRLAIELKLYWFIMNLAGQSDIWHLDVSKGESMLTQKYTRILRYSINQTPQ